MKGDTKTWPNDLTVVDAYQPDADDGGTVGPAAAPAGAAAPDGSPPPLGPVPGADVQAALQGLPQGGQVVFTGVVTVTFQRDDDDRPVASAAVGPLSLLVSSRVTDAIRVRPFRLVLLCVLSEKDWSLNTGVDLDFTVLRGGVQIGHEKASAKVLGETVKYPVEVRLTQDVAGGDQVHVDVVATEK